MEEEAPPPAAAPTVSKLTARSHSEKFAETRDKCAGPRRPPRGGGGGDRAC